MTARDIRWHRKALRGHAIAASYYAAIDRADLMTMHVHSASGLLRSGGGAWDGAAS